MTPGQQNTGPGGRAKLVRVTHAAEIALQDGEAVATIVPDRGAIVTRFDVAGRRVLYLDRETLADRTKNVRGGIPVLFPSPGKLAGDAWQRAGASGAMTQHGFARSVAWRIAETAASSAVLVLESNDETRRQYPWDFTFVMTFALHGATLRLEQRIENRAREPMPFGVGFHPYFFVRDADKPRTHVATAATRAFDNVTKRETAVTGAIELARPEVDLHLLDHGSTASTLTTPDGRVELVGSPEYTHWVVWTLAGRDFVCVEPWTCPGNALNTGERLITLAPSEHRTLWLEITAAPT